MKLHADQPAGNYIQACRTDAVQIGGRWCPTPAIVSAEAVITDWRPRDPAALTAADFAAALGLEPELILLGTGAAQRFPAHAVLVAVMGQGIGVEVMATDAACRTYNVLVAEDRRVVAVLL